MMDRMMDMSQRELFVLFIVTDSLFFSNRKILQMSLQCYLSVIVI